VAGRYIFPTAWGPSYANSSAILGVSAAFGIIILALLRWYLVRLNRKMDEAAAESHLAVEAQQALAISGVQIEGNAVAWRYQI
jgi:cytochrome oxidase assembly protein ShyY1